MSTTLIIWCVIGSWAVALYFICQLLKPIASDVATIKADTEEIKRDLLHKSLTHGSYPSKAPPPITPPRVR